MLKKLSKSNKRILLVFVFIFGFISIYLIGSFVGTWTISDDTSNVPSPTIEPISPNPNIDGIVTIRWTKTVPLDMRNIYELYRSKDNGAWTLVDDNTRWGTAYKDENLANGIYSYKVRAREAGVFSGYSNIRTVSVEQYIFIPIDPVALTLPLIVPNPDTDGHIQLKLTNGVPNAIGYDIYKSSDDINYVLLHSINTQITTVWTHHDSAVEDGKTYYYKVISRGVYGNSDFSNTVSVKIELYIPPPNAPVLNLIQPPISTDGNVVIRWGSVSGAISYELYRSKDNSPYILITTIASISYTDQGLLDGVYVYKAKAISDSGVSDFSNTKTVTVQIPVIPNPPILSTFNPLIDTDGNVNVQWLGSLDVTSYDIYRNKDGSSYILIRNINSFSYTDSGLLDGVYRYKIKAKNIVGDSGFSNIESVTVQLPKPPQGIPILSLVSPALSVDGNNRMKWTAVPYATTYEIYRSKDASSYVLIKTTTSTSYTDSELLDGIYNYRVKAKNIDGDSDLSNVLYFRVEISEESVDISSEKLITTENLIILMVGMILTIVILVFWLRRRK